MKGSQGLLCAWLAVSAFGCAAKMPEPAPPLPVHERSTNVGPELTRLTEPINAPEALPPETRTRLRETRTLGQNNDSPVYFSGTPAPVAGPTHVTNVSTTVNTYSTNWGGGFGGYGYGYGGGGFRPGGYGFNDNRPVSRPAPGPPTTVGGDWAPPRETQPPLIRSFGK